MKYFAVTYASFLIVMSLAALVAYGLDKRRARLERRRVSEKTLHLIAFLGGWPGALAARWIFRHKTQKLSFRIVFWIVFVLHLAIVGGIVYLIMQWN